MEKQKKDKMEKQGRDKMEKQEKDKMEKQEREQAVSSREKLKDRLWVQKPGSPWG